MNFLDIFASKSKHLTWFRLEDDHVEDGKPAASIDNDQAYFVIRMKEMYLTNSRKLWRKLYPMLHGFVEYQKKEEHAVAGPGQLKDIADSNLDRVINLNYRLTGPTPYKGGDVSLLVGLYSVPGEDLAKGLINTVSAISSLGGLALGQTVEIVNVVKNGVENIIGLNEAQLQLGIRDTFYPNNPLRTGYHVAINAETVDVDKSQLWLKKGRLIKGNSPLANLPYEDNDYLVLEIERRTTRDDWPGLPAISEFQARFSSIMGDGALTVQQKRDRLKDLWPQFANAVNTSPYLVQPDKEQIALSVSKDLTARLKAEENNNPFVETRSWGSKSVERKPATEFDLTDVADYLDANDPQSVREAKEALAGDAF